MHLVNEVCQDIEAEGHIYFITLDQEWFTGNTVYDQNHRLLKIKFSTWKYVICKIRYCGLSLITSVQNIFQLHSIMNTQNIWNYMLTRCWNQCRYNIYISIDEHLRWCLGQTILFKSLLPKLLYSDVDILILKGPIPYIYVTQVWLSLCLQMS